jgi:hypothetical protein
MDSHCAQATASQHHDKTTRQVQVIATTDAGTRAALLEARQLARRLNLANIVLLVPRIAASPAEIDAPEGDTSRVERYRQIADAAGVDAVVRLCVCDTVSDAFHWMLPRACIVVVGGHRRWWWPTPEQRIAGLVKKTGRVTVFAEASELHAAS